MPLARAPSILLQIFLLFALSGEKAVSSEDYPPIPHPELYEKIWADPAAALVPVQKLYKQGKAQQDTALQLDMLLLMAYGYDSLEKKEELSSTLSKGIELARKTGDRRNLAYFYLRKAYSLNKQGQRRKALELCNQAINIAHELEDNRLLAISLSDRGLILTEQGSEEAALEDLLAAHEIFEKHGDEENLSILYSHIGNVYFNLGQYDKAILFHQKSAESLSDEEFRNIAIVKLNIGAAYTLDKQYGKAEQFLGEARQIFEREKILDSLGLAEYWLGTLREGQKASREATEHYLRALSIFMDEQNVSMQFNCRTRLARLYLQLNDTTSARHQLNEAETLVSGMNNDTAMLTVTRIESRLAAANKDFEAAFNHCQRSASLAEKIHAEASRSNLERLQVQFESAQKEAENALLREKNKVQKLQISSNQAQRNLALIIGVLILIILLFTFLGFLQQRRMHRKMAILAMSDELTGAANRRRIFQMAQETFNQSVRYKTPFSLAMVDLDHFKEINDRYGHEAGDETLKAFVRVAQQELRKQDAIGRMGGEEWLLIFPHTGAQDAANSIRRIAAAFRNTKVKGIPQDHPLTFSAGVTSYRQTDESLETMLRRADKVLYAAKNKGRDQVILAED